MRTKRSLTACWIETRYSPTPLATERARTVAAESSARTTTPATGAPVSLSRTAPRAICASAVVAATQIVATAAASRCIDTVIECGTVPAFPSRSETRGLHEQVAARTCRRLRREEVRGRVLQHHS